MSELKKVLISRPEYDEIVPSTGKQIKILPYKVADEKLLLIAAESKNTQQMAKALKKLIGNNSEGIEVEELETYDLEYLFLKLRGVSVGEVSRFKMKCTECDHYTDVEVDLNDVTVKKDDDFTNIIKVDDNLGFEMKQLSIEEALNANTDDPSEVLKLVARSVKTVFYGDDTITVGKAEQADLLDIIESLTTAQFNNFRNFFNKQPRVYHDLDFECSNCSHQNHAPLEGLQAFFQ